MNQNLMDRFFKACGGVGPLFVEVHDDGVVHRARRIFSQPFLLCGRHPDADLELQNERVSRRHCYLQMVDGRIFSMDLGSRAGTRVDGTIGRSGWLDPSRLLSLGPVGLRFHGGERQDQALDQETPSPLSSRYPGARDLPEVSLEVMSETNRLESWPMRQAMVLIGTSADCRVKLLSPLVSDYHCALLRTDTGVWLVDLLSQGGVYLDGTAVRVACLSAGTEIGIGPFTIRVKAGHRGHTSDELRMASSCQTPARAAPCRSGVLGSVGSHDGLSSLASEGEYAKTLADQLRQVRMMSRMVAAMQRDQRDVQRAEAQDLRGLSEQLTSLDLELAPRPSEAIQDRICFEDESIEVGSGFGDFDWHEELESILRNAAAKASHTSFRRTRVDQMGAGTRDWLASAPAPGELEMAIADRRDPRVLHAIASEFLSAYHLDGRRLRAKFMRSLLRTHDATGTVRRAR